MTGRVARGTVLVDTNAIIEAHRTGVWRALAGGYQVESVEDCVIETQTGFQWRRPEQSIAGMFPWTILYEHRSKQCC